MSRPGDDAWAAGTYEGARAAQARAVAALTPLERLRWLDAALLFARRVGAQRHPVLEHGDEEVGGRSALERTPHDDGPGHLV